MINNETEPKKILISLISAMPKDSHLKIVQQLPPSLDITEDDLNTNVDYEADGLLVRDYFGEEKYVGIRNSEFCPWIEVMLFISNISAGISIAAIAPLIALLHKFHTRSSSVTEDQYKVLTILAKDRKNCFTVEKIAENVEKFFPAGRNLTVSEIQVILNDIESVTLNDGSSDSFVIKSDDTPPLWRIHNV